MKKQLLIVIGCLMMAGFAYGANEAFSITDNTTNLTSGTYNAGSAFTLKTTGTWSGYTADGYSMWLEVPTALAPYITITGENYLTFKDANNGGPKAFTDPSGADSGFLTTHNTNGATPAAGDVGGSVDFTNNENGSNDYAAGTYTLNNITFQLAANAPTGTYNLNSTVAGAKPSEITDSGFTGHNAPQDTFVLTVGAAAVPEPATMSLFGLGGLGTLGMAVIRRRRNS